MLAYATQHLSTGRTSVDRNDWNAAMRDLPSIRILCRYHTMHKLNQLA
jgi:hypothetical protein